MTSMREVGKNRFDQIDNRKFNRKGWKPLVTKGIATRNKDAIAVVAPGLSTKVTRALLVANIMS